MTNYNIKIAILINLTTATGGNSNMWSSKWKLSANEAIYSVTSLYSQLSGGQVWIQATVSRLGNGTFTFFTSTQTD